MDGRFIRRPAIDLLCGRSQCLLFLNATARRHESSFRRTKQRLNVKPDSSFILSNSSPKHDYIIFNPPSSAPSVLHTPLKFLPKDDKRRQFLEATSRRTPGPTRIPPLISKPSIPVHHLTDADIAEIQRLRSSDPMKWSQNKLAKKFNCSMHFIQICCQASAEKKELDRQQLEAIKARWGPKRTRAREDRLKRRDLILKDD
jgi:hypothetical protein